QIKVFPLGYLLTLLLAYWKRKDNFNELITMASAHYLHFIMNKITLVLSFLIFIGLATAFTLQEKAHWQSRHVSIHENGTLQYPPDKLGNIIPDFSRVGYHQGDKPIPDVPVKLVISPPATGNSQEIIQSAIDELAATKPDENGFRGTILLKKGIYRIPGTLRVTTSGIVLRGEG